MYWRFTVTSVKKLFEPKIANPIDFCRDYQAKPKAETDNL